MYVFCVFCGLKRSFGIVFLDFGVPSQEMEWFEFGVQVVEEGEDVRGAVLGREVEVETELEVGARCGAGFQFEEIEA